MIFHNSSMITNGSSQRSSQFDEDEILSRFKGISYDIGNKVISLSEDVILSCNSWSHPRSNIVKIEHAINDPRKKHIVFYDMWHDSVVDEILSIFKTYRNRHWSSIEFRGCQEKHAHAILQLVLDLDIVQTVAFSLTDSMRSPMSAHVESTFDLISRSTKTNERFECLIFHSRPIDFIRAESLRRLQVKHLHFLERVQLKPDEIRELSEGLMQNHSLKSFSFLGCVQESNDHNVGDLLHALKSHPSLKRLMLRINNKSNGGFLGLPEVLGCQDSTLQSVTLSGGCKLNSLFAKSSLSKGLQGSNLKHLYLKDVCFSSTDVQELAMGLKTNESLESVFVNVSECIDISAIAFAIEGNNRIQRLSLMGKCSLGVGVRGIANLLSSKRSTLKDLHLSGAFHEKSLRHKRFLEIFLDGLRGNQHLESLDLSLNALTDEEVVSIYNEIPTCKVLHDLDLGMNDISSRVLGFFADMETSTHLSVLRISSKRFSFFETNDQVCERLAELLQLNPKLGDVSFSTSPVEWHHSYKHDGTTKWHHFFPSYIHYGLHSNNKRLNYIKAKELTRKGRKHLERVQFLLDYNWTGRGIATSGSDCSTTASAYPSLIVPLALWPRILERVWKGRTCFWTGREQGTQLECAHSVVYTFLREHIVNGSVSGSSCAVRKTDLKSPSSKRQRHTVQPVALVSERKKLKT